MLIDDCGLWLGGQNIVLLTMSWFNRGNNPMNCSTPFGGTNSQLASRSN